MKILGVDTGGTFTDFVLFDAGKLRIHKVLSTPHAPEQAILQGIDELGLQGQALRLVHGSTVATNALLEGKGVKTAYITNRGLADVLTIGRQARRELYVLNPEPVAPPVPAELCLEVDCRLAADGTVVQALTEDELARLVTALQQLDVKAVAINLLFSFLDAADEQRIAAAMPENVFVACSSEVLPEYREYERGIATWINASLGPLMQGYLQRLSQQLPDCNIAVMQSSAGTVAIEAAERRAVHLLLSGPAGGLMAAEYMAKVSGFENVLTFDMGGTSTDVAMIQGQIQLSSTGAIGHYPVGVPMVDMHTIGAGGGSIAYVDEGGLLQVGPESAGADPGPACYGRGGTQATVTDANCVLGRLPATVQLGGSLQLEYEQAHAAVANLAQQIGLSVTETAAGIVRLANEHMVQALRLISVQRGVDVRDYTLTCFGGAGGLHVCALAELMGMKRAFVPIYNGVLSAFGMLVAPPKRELSLTLGGALEDCSLNDLEKQFVRLHLQAEQELLEEGVSAEALAASRSVDLRYLGQSYTINIVWQGHVDGVISDFHQQHRRRYGHEMDLPVELVNIRLHMQGCQPTIGLAELSAARPVEPMSYVTVAGYTDSVPCYFRDSLLQTQVLQGPAIIIDKVATLFIEQSWQAQVDFVGNLLIECN